MKRMLLPAVLIGCFPVMTLAGGHHDHGWGSWGFSLGFGGDAWFGGLSFGGGGYYPGYAHAGYSGYYPAYRPARYYAPVYYPPDPAPVVVAPAPVVDPGRPLYYTAPARVYSPSYYVAPRAYSAPSNRYYYGR